MPIAPEEWQKRLDRHFTQLANSRAALDLPIFALEHGLTPQEFKEVSILLNEKLSLGLNLGPYWLLWVVYATEIGYDYDGDEYWNSFEERTPRWKDRGNRNQLRDWFTRFRVTYRGVMPTGAWSKCFKIITWPITNSILPKYLQWQFAKALYSFRYRLAQLRDPTPANVGQLLATHAFEASSRFQEFLQQEELAGRIVLALVGNISVSGHDSIQPATLQRLVTDLERVQSAREWLKETQRFVADRMTGAARPQAGSTSTASREYGGPDDEADLAPNIHPHLMLRPSGTQGWSVVVEIPSLAPIARLHSELNTFLLKTRCKIAGTGDTWFPNAWLLSGVQRRVLKSWPGSSAPLISFEKTNTQMEEIISAEARVSDGPVWLFRIGSDGLAKEIIGKIIRPGRNYILLSDRDIPLREGFVEHCDIDCKGIRGVIIRLPETLFQSTVSFLEALSLGVARTVRIWPAGLPARGWDGEGNSEWLTTDRPCFGMTHDHTVDSYTLRLNNNPEVVIKAPPSGDATFISLPSLSIGRHTLEVKAHRLESAASTLSAAAAGVVTLDIREPQAWVPGSTSHTGLFVSVEPSEPPLDLFWQGDVSISIMGPPGHRVSCTMKLLTPKREELLSELIGTFELPVTNDEWRRRFSQFVSVEKREWAYLESGSGSLLIKEDELGEYTLRLDRDLKPLRWICRSVNHVTTARLIDDTGLEELATPRFISLRQPAVAYPVEVPTALSGVAIPAPGGLYSAQHSTWDDAIVVSMPVVEKGFQGLIIEPDLNVLNGPSISIIEILQLVSLWGRARLFGPLASLRCRRVVDRLINRLYTRLCGLRWGEAEAAFSAQPDSEFKLKQLEHAIGGIASFGVLLRRDYAKFELRSTEMMEWFADAANRYQICSDKRLSESALRLALEPQSFISLPRPSLEQLLTDFKDQAVLLRGARFLVLLSETLLAAALSKVKA
jgi:hypothetical protein